MSLDLGGEKRIDQRPEPGQIGVGCPGTPGVGHSQSDLGRGVGVRSVQVKSKMFCDWVLIGIEKKVSLRSMTEK